MQEIMQRMSEVLHLDVLLQLVLAVLLGGAIGLERELSGKPAGLRTNILICMGATLFTALSVKMSLGRGDPARVAAQILPGVGFIGAGTILHARGSVTGLTSAATIWVVAAIGMALGTGEYEEALGAALLVMVILLGLGYLEVALARQATRSHLTVHAKPEAISLEELETVVRRSGVDVTRIDTRRENVDLVVELDLRGPKRLHDQALIALLHHPTVRSVSSGE
ncbi:MAG TPA: MgtC/SapB family protein [Gemmatimonadales bacterium]|nr:MgtC/SapB family protein [Gemmatimonadales bacterium]